MANIVILGTGMAGFGAAHHLHAEGYTPIMYDKNNYHGGHTASFRGDTGFLFDVGPHISYTKDPRIQQLFAESLDQQFETLQIYLNNYWRSYWPQHPVQLHLHGLPEEVIIKVISDFVKERETPERPVTNYADWLLTSFGQTFAELFPMQYTRKYHTTTAENLTTDWLGPRIYRPNLEEVLRGVLSPSAPQVHYITHFRYPTHGGFVSYLKKFVPFGNINFNHQLSSIDPHERLLTFANGVVAGYDALISSVPLPDLLPMIEGTPPEVLDACRRLSCSTCVLVNLGINREDISRAHITYFYDEDICFSRLGFPHMLAASNAPAGTGSIQAEIYFSEKYKPFTGSAEDWIDPVITDLRRCGVLHDDDQILFRQAMLLPYANIIFDHERAAALQAVHEYLDELNIAYCGRYGDWGYLWTDESFKSGENAAEKALQRLSTRKPSKCTMQTVLQERVAAMAPAQP
jgi:protoporphyrinogen oxidase